MREEPSRSCNDNIIWYAQFLNNVTNIGCYNKVREESRERKRQRR